jgi:hypothetical protein
MGKALSVQDSSWCCPIDMCHSRRESKGVAHGAVQCFLSSPPPPPLNRTLFADNLKHDLSLRVKNI